MTIRGYSYEEAHPSPCTKVIGVPLPGSSCQRTIQFAVDEKNDSIALYKLTVYKCVNIFILKATDKSIIQ